jgi:hypothetical protein
LFPAGDRHDNRNRSLQAGRDDRQERMPCALPQDRAPDLRRRRDSSASRFIWSENGIAGGVYQWETLADAKAFYQGPWLDGILSRYGVYPEIEYFVTFAVAEQSGEVIYTEAPLRTVAHTAAA